MQGVSAWSRTIILLGLNRRTCLTISLPIDPAAPVTKIVCLSAV
jgi:hypothetical protein